MQDLLVMKFGGTSVGSPERIRIACDLIAAEAARRPVTAVVSAMSKITDLLLDTTRHAEADDQAGIDRGLSLLETRHLEAAGQLAAPGELDRVRGKVGDLIAEFRRIVNGMQMLGHRPPRAVDEAIAVGERLSAWLVSEHL
ncbi:MAG: aspartate kinase, partial [Acidobacteriota bacterium]